MGRKSGVPREQVASLYKNIAEAQANGFVDDYHARPEPTNSTLSQNQN